MKDSPTWHMALLAIVLAVACTSQAAATRLEAAGKPPTVTKVVDFLGQLLSKSKTEGEAEAKIYAKLKCYCDDNDKSKSSEIKDLTEGISKLESELEGLQSSNGELSTQCAKLKTDIADNAASQSSAKGIRSRALKNFKGEKADLTKGIAQMTSAIKMLTAVGADQTKGSGADHEKFMAGYKKKSASFLGLEGDVRHALEAASALLPAEQRSTFNSFIQAPFTGAYTSQSAGVMGILKSMQDTFESNLQAASEAEDRDAKAHAELMKTLTESEKEMKQSFEDKQEELGENDSELAAKRLQLKSAKESKESAEGFLEKLRPMCETRAKEFSARKFLRANEESAIAEAMSILSSDNAFKAFAQAADNESFLQLRSQRRTGVSHIRLDVQRILEQASVHDNRVARLAVLLQANNPFPAVLGEIVKMEKLISEEQDSDEEKHAFCKKETDTGTKKLKATNNEIDKTEEALDKLEDSVEKPQTGLKAQEAALEKAMEENVANQKKETTMRQQDNVQYQSNVDQLVKAELLLEKAIKVLKKFYSSLDDKSGLADSFVQQQEDPKPPSESMGVYKGQSADAEGEKGAIGMLKFIMSDIAKQNAAAHKEENEAQHDFEDSMAKLTEERKNQEKNMIDLKNAMAKAEQETVDKTQDLKQANKDKTATEAYLADIKPGCDFIFDNFDLRTKNRKNEAASLVQAKTLLKGSPVYQAASAEAEAEALGPCRAKCNVPDHVNCKACLARTSIPGYCAGHKGTPGC